MIMSNIDEKYLSHKTMETIQIENVLNGLFFIKTKEDEERKGLHASSVIVSDNDFCYREQVLSVFYKRGLEEPTPLGLKRIFRRGDVIHEQWQKMVVDGGISRGIEKRAYYERYNLYLTPDLMCAIGNKLYICEIKSCNTFTFKHLFNSHPTGSKQLQLYMHFYGIPNGFVLVDDKNDQNIKIFPVRYNPDIVRNYIIRLENVHEYINLFKKTRKLPERKCKNYNVKRCQRCAMREACFGVKVERIK